MSNIIEQMAIIKISQLAKDTAGDELNVLTSEITDQVTEILEELLGTGLVVEIETGE